MPLLKNVCMHRTPASDLGMFLFWMMGGLANEIGTIRHWATGLNIRPSCLMTKGLADYVYSKGMQFGLWFEPEMISLNILVYWHTLTLLQPGRAKSYGRNQYVLDMSCSGMYKTIYTIKW